MRPFTRRGNGLYEVNGVDLTGSEFGLLRILVEDERPGEIVDRLQSSDLQRYRELLFGLRRKGMIDGYPGDNRFNFTRVREEGRSFVADYDSKVEAGIAAEAAREREVAEQRRADLRASRSGALWGAIAGGIVTILLKALLGI